MHYTSISRACQNHPQKEIHGVLTVTQTSWSKLWVVLTRLSHILMETNNSGCVTETTLVSEQVRGHEVCEFWTYLRVCVCVCGGVSDSACHCRCWARRTSNAMRTLGNSSSSSLTQRDSLWVSGRRTQTRVHLRTGRVTNYKNYWSRQEENPTNKHWTFQVLNIMKWLIAYVRNNGIFPHTALCHEHIESQVHLICCPNSPMNAVIVWNPRKNQTVGLNSAQSVTLSWSCFGNKWCDLICTAVRLWHWIWLDISQTHFLWFVS